LVSIQEYKNQQEFELDLNNGIRVFSKKKFYFRLSISEKEIDEDISFEYCGFFDVEFKNVTFNGNVSFYKVNFKGKVLSETTFKGEKTSFEKCNFKYPTYFNNSTFFNNIDFNETIFENKALFQKCEFYGTTSFHNTKFLKLADFYQATFHQLQIFYKTDFNKNVVFSRVNFMKNICFHYVSVESNLIFRHANFVKGLDLSLTIINGQINFFNAKLKKFESVSDPKDDKIGAEKYDEYISKGIITHKNKRETFRVIKNELISQNNVIDSLTYKSLEVSALEEELKNNKDSEFWDKVILFFSKYSNLFGESWSRALVFILVIGSFFYMFSLLGIENYPYTWGVGNTWDALDFYLGNFFEFLNPTHKMDYIGKEYQLNAFFKLFNFVGRIFVSFGIYQLIVSFRKFSKK
jgi:uncharacterized protein YjbI with pentapeptide repeats